MDKKFVHLHVHSFYSLLDGLSSPEDLAKRAREQGSPALAITDHGNMHGVVEFFKACKKEGIKAIIGCECFVALRSLHDKEAGIDNDRHHLLLLVKNQKGYENLIKMVTISYLEGIYYKPRIDFDLLKKHSEGLIACSACLHGEVPKAYLQKGLEEARKVAQKYHDLFGEDFYLEIQYHPNIPEQDIVNQGLIQLSKEMNIPLVATNDVHYAGEDDADAHDTLLCIQTNALKSDTNRMSMAGSDFSLIPPAKMYEYFADTPEACENTLKVAEKCDFEFEFGQNLLPLFPTKEGQTDAEYLREKCREGIRERFGFDTENPETEEQKSIVERLEHELSTINKMGFASYFLIVWDFVRWAKEQNIAVGPGRGSAAGSLVSYVLKITDIDPLEHELFFERFLNPERISMPDIDLDFADDRRDEVIEYVREKYGSDRVAQICTFGTMAARAAIKDVGRAYGIPFGEMNDFAKLIPEKPGTTLQEALEMSPELRRDIESNEMHQKIFKTALKLEGCVRHVSVHACAVVISPDDVTRYMALQHPPKDDNVIITQFSQKPVEALGLLKMDFLGLKNLTILEKARKIIERTKKTEINFATVPMDDKKTFELLSKGQTTGVFQLESAGMKRYLKELKPTNFEDIIAMVSLFRPGPMEWIPDYIKGKHGKREVTYVHESVKSTLEKTFGIAIYQEQILKIAQVLSGFTLGEADILRRAIGKKIPEELASQRKKFIEGAVAKGHSENMAVEVFEKVVEPFAGYGFNRSHAASYAMIAYRTAYLKANYPTEFMAALLSCDAGNTDKVCRDIEECERMGIEILPPSVSDSLKNFTVVKEGQIRFGLSAIKGIGDGVVDDILIARKDGPFKDFEDLLLRVPQKIVNKKSMESLAKAGALTEFVDPKVAIENIEAINAFVKDNNEVSNGNPHQEGLFGAMEEEVSRVKLNLKAVENSTRIERLTWEQEILGLFVSDHPLKNMENYFDKHGTLISKFFATDDKKMPKNPVKIGGIISGVRKIITKTKSTMAVLTLEDPTGKIEVTLFPKAYQQYFEILETAQILMVKGKWDRRNGFLQIIADSLEAVEFEKARAESKKLPVYEKEEEEEEKTDNIDEEIREIEEIAVVACEKAAQKWNITIPDGVSRSDLKDLQEILLATPGDCTVEIEINGQNIVFPKKVNYSSDLENRIEKVLKR